MHLTDLLHFSFANIFAHKLRCLKVAIIVGTLFSLLFSGSFLLQGAAHTSLAHMTDATHGQILVRTSISQPYCTDCDPATELQRIHALASQYHGTVISTTAYQTDAGIIPALSLDYLADLIVVPLTQIPEDAIPILPTYDLATRWLRLPNSSSGQSTFTKLRRLESLRNSIIGQTFQDRSNLPHTAEEQPPILNPNQTIFYGVGLLPSAASNIRSLSLDNLNDSQNPLNLILSPAVLSDDSSLSSAPMALILDSPNNHLDQLTPVSGVTLLTFSTATDANNYLNDPANTCSIFDYHAQLCDPSFRYESNLMISNPVQTTLNYQQTWTVFSIFSYIITAIAVIVSITTYIRLIHQDLKTIALYQATGATVFQTRLIYFLYLFSISLFAILFALVVGLLLTLTANFLSQTALCDIFTLAFGNPVNHVFLCSWTNHILPLIFTALLTVPISLVFSYRQFHPTHLTTKLKQ